jgi:hypothetical protein
LNNSSCISVAREAEMRWWGVIGWGGEHPCD